MSKFSGMSKHFLLILESNKKLTGLVKSNNVSVMKLEVQKTLIIPKDEAL